MTTTSETPGGRPSRVELNGINVIAESERKGPPRDLFWPWFAANISVLAISYGSFIVGFGVSFWQATIAAVVGIVLSFALCGVVALAGKRGSAPTMVLSRAAFGVTGNALPPSCPGCCWSAGRRCSSRSRRSATATVFNELGWGGGDGTKVLGFLVTAALVVGAGILGFDVIMRLQTWITLATIVLTIGFIALTLDEVDWDDGLGRAVGLHPGVHRRAGPRGHRFRGRLGQHRRRLLALPASGGVLAAACSAGRRSAARRRPIVLTVFGIMLALLEQGALSDAISADPIGALTTLLPTWYLVPFASSRCSAWWAARCSTSTPPALPCSPSASRCRGRRGRHRRRHHVRSARSTSCSSRTTSSCRSRAS